MSNNSRSLSWRRPGEAMCQIRLPSLHTQAGRSQCCYRAVLPSTLCQPPLARPPGSVPWGTHRTERAESRSGPSREGGERQQSWSATGDHAAPLKVGIPKSGGCAARGCRPASGRPQLPQACTPADPPCGSGWASLGSPETHAYLHPCIPMHIHANLQPCKSASLQNQHGSPPARKTALAPRHAPSRRAAQSRRRRASCTR